MAVGISNVEVSSIAGVIVGKVISVNVAVGKNSSEELKVGDGFLPVSGINGSATDDSRELGRLQEASKTTTMTPQRNVR